MEKEQLTEQQVVDQVYGFAANLLVNEGRSPAEVEQALVQQGLNTADANIVVSNLETQIREAKKDAGQKDMLYGALWCIGGTVATLANVGFIFWGAIVFGGFQFLRGAYRAFS